MTPLRRPTAALVQDPEQLATFLLGVYDALLTLGKPRPAASVPALKAITLPLYADARKQPGDTNGEIGPRAIIVTGKTVTKDGGEGVFVWDSTSTAADDNATVLKVDGVAVGRWRSL